MEQEESQRPAWTTEGEPALKKKKIRCKSVALTLKCVKHGHVFKKKERKKGKVE
jgi:hypothetical protein